MSRLCRFWIGSTLPTITAGSRPGVFRQSFRLPIGRRLSSWSPFSTSTPGHIPDSTESLFQEASGVEEFEDEELSHAEDAQQSVVQSRQLLRRSTLQAFHHRRDVALERQGIDVRLTPDQIAEQHRLIDLATSVEDLVALFRMSIRERFVYPPVLYVHLWDRLIEFSQTQPDFRAKLSLMPDLVSMETSSFLILTDPECTPDILRKLAHLWSFLPYVCRGWVHLQRQAYLMRDFLQPHELSVIICASQKVNPDADFINIIKPKLYEHLPTINFTSLLMIMEALGYSESVVKDPVLTHAIFDRGFHLVSKAPRFDHAVYELVCRMDDIKRSLLEAGCHVELFLTSVAELPGLFNFSDGRPTNQLDRLCNLLLRFRSFGFRHTGFLEMLAPLLHSNATNLGAHPHIMINAIDGYAALDPVHASKLLHMFSPLIMRNIDQLTQDQVRRLAAACWSANYKGFVLLQALTSRFRKLQGFAEVQGPTMDTVF